MVFDPSSPRDHMPLIGIRKGIILKRFSDSIKNRQRVHMALIDKGRLINFFFNSMIYRTIQTTHAPKIVGRKKFQGGYFFLGG